MRLLRECLDKRAVLFASRSVRRNFDTADRLSPVVLWVDEILATRPSSVTMRERVEALRVWARDRTTPVD